MRKILFVLACTAFLLTSCGPLRDAFCPTLPPLGDSTVIERIDTQYVDRYIDTSTDTAKGSFPCDEVVLDSSDRKRSDTVYLDKKGKQGGRVYRGPDNSLIVECFEVTDSLLSENQALRNRLMIITKERQIKHTSPPAVKTKIVYKIPLWGWVLIVLPWIVLVLVVLLQMKVLSFAKKATP